MNSNPNAVAVPAANQDSRLPNPGNFAGAELPHFLTKPQLAAVLQCTPRHIESLTARGILRAVKLGRSIRYSRVGILRIIEELEGSS